MPVTDLFHDAIESTRRGQDLDADQTETLIDAMLRGEATDESVSKLLLALRGKGEAVSELVGAATAMRRHMTRIPHSHDVLLDTCGTGGSGSGTFNISTAVALLTSACGVPVAKHGNRRATSHSGSADVLECLGVPITAEPDAVADQLSRIGICFCFAAKLHPAMRHVVAIRRALGVPTLFNLLGPLCNPAGATHQVLGTASADAQVKIAQALRHLATRRSFVLHAEDGQDEVSLDGATHCYEVVRGTEELPGKPIEHIWRAADFGVPPASAASLVASDPTHSARIIQDLFAGQPGPPRDVVLAGTAAALLLVGRVDDLRSGVDVAADAIDRGGAMNQLERLRSE